MLRDGDWARLARAPREVVQRDAATGSRCASCVDGVDELGRALHAEGAASTSSRLHLNPNLFTVNCLTEWTFDGITAYGEDHDNWSAAAARAFFRSYARASGEPP